MSYNFGPEAFLKNIKREQSTILVKQLPGDVITPVLALMRIAKHFADYHILLESAESRNEAGRYCVIAFNPDLVWKCHGQTSFLNSNFKLDKSLFLKEEGNPLDNLRAFIAKSQIDWDQFLYDGNKLPQICSGVFGYMGYDMVRLMENLPDNNLPDQINIPDSIFIRPTSLVIFDRLFDRILICAPYFKEQHCDSQPEEIYKKLSDKIEAIAKSIFERSKDELEENQKEKNILTTQKSFVPTCSKEEYCNSVKKSQEYIVDGDIFQILPSQRFVAKFDPIIDPLYFYRSLRSLNPSPFLFYLKFDDFVLTGSSPEIMASLIDKKITIRPLAGTRKRGKNSDEDKKIAAELLLDQKELAEHLMLIDLGRNDVGLVAKDGSVVLTKKMNIEYYSHVMHISSTVEGIIRDDLDAMDVLVAGFPAGTVSGAPKIRAMEIIEEIEKVKRSFYSGCVGYFASNGDMETCITLRSAIIKDGKIYLQAGAGVVFDSVPELEHQECINKVSALMAAYDKMADFL